MLLNSNAASTLNDVKLDHIILIIIIFGTNTPLPYQPIIINLLMVLVCHSLQWINALSASNLSFRNNTRCKIPIYTTSNIWCKSNRYCSTDNIRTNTNATFLQKCKRSIWNYNCQTTFIGDLTGDN